MLRPHSQAATALCTLVMLSTCAHRGDPPLPLPLPPQLLREVELLWNVAYTLEGTQSAGCSPPTGRFLYGVRKVQPVPGGEGELADKVCGQFKKAWAARLAPGVCTRSLAAARVAMQGCTALVQWGCTHASSGPRAAPHCWHPLSAALAHMAPPAAHRLPVRGPAPRGRQGQGTVCNQRHAERHRHLPASLAGRRQGAAGVGRFRRGAQPVPMGPWRRHRWRC